MSQNETFVIKLKDQFSSQLKAADNALDDAKDSAEGLNDAFSSMERLAGAAVTALGIREFIQATNEFSKMRAAVKSYTGESGKAADNLITQASAIASTFGGETDEILRAANAMTKQVGGTMQSNIDLIVQGFKKGANANGEFLKQLTEYPVFMKEAGLDAAQSIALITQASKDGIYDDKAFDSVKEMTLSLTEMTQIQRDAIGRIGLDADEMLSSISSGALSPFQAMQRIVGVMDDFDISAQKTIVADIFKGAGEDSGLQFIKSLKDIDLELGNIQDSSDDYSNAMFEMTSMFEGLKTTILTAVMPAMSGVMNFIAANKPLILGLATAVGILAIGLGAMTIQTWLLNSALWANPIVWIIAAVAGLIGAVVWAYNEFEFFQKIIDGVWKGIKILAGWIWDALVVAFDGIKVAISAVIDWFIEFAPLIKKYLLMAIGFVVKLNPVYWMVQGVKKLFPELYASIVSQFTKVFGWLKKQWNKVKEFFGFGVEVDADMKVDAEKTNDTDTTTPDSPTDGGLNLGGNSLGAAASTAKNSSNLGSGVGSVSNSAPKTFNINIGNLVNEFSVRSETVEMSRQSIQDMILETLLSAVNDVQTAID